jgi:hypothetical protein
MRLDYERMTLSAKERGRMNVCVHEMPFAVLSLAVQLVV